MDNKIGVFISFYTDYQYCVNRNTLMLRDKVTEFYAEMVIFT